MRVYIASRYQLPESVEIYEKLLENKIDVFLPKTINLDAKTSEERNRVYNICAKKIRDDCTCYRQGFYRYRYIDTVSRKISD